MDVDWNFLLSGEESCSTDARVSCHCMDVDSSVQTL